MVDDVMYIVRFKFMEDGYNNCPIRQCSKESDSPMRAVSSANSDFISFADSTFFKNDMEFFDLASYVFIL